MHLAGLDSTWFAIQVKSRSEKAVASMLQVRCYGYVLPTYAPQRTGRVRPDAPISPGYVFCRVDEHVRSPIVTTPLVIRIVGYGNRPSPLRGVVGRVAGSGGASRLVVSVAVLNRSISGPKSRMTGSHHSPKVSSLSRLGFQRRTSCHGSFL